MHARTPLETDVAPPVTESEVNPTLPHAPQHKTLGSDPLAPHDIGAPTQTELATTETHAQTGITNAATAQTSANNVGSALSSHTSNVSNPHSVTKTQVGLDNVPNIDVNSLLTSHTGNTSNPHGVTKTQVGLGSVQNIDFMTKAMWTRVIHVGKNGTNTRTGVDIYSAFTPFLAIQSAFDASSIYGDVFWIHPGAYSEDIIPPDGSFVYCDAGVIINGISGDTISTPSGQAASIFGHAIISNSIDNKSVLNSTASGRLLLQCESLTKTNIGSCIRHDFGTLQIESDYITSYSHNGITSVFTALSTPDNDQALSVIIKARIIDTSTENEGLAGGCFVINRTLGEFSLWDFRVEADTITSSQRTCFYIANNTDASTFTGFIKARNISSGNSGASVMEIYCGNIKVRADTIDGYTASTSSGVINLYGAGTIDFNGCKVSNANGYCFTNTKDAGGGGTLNILNCDLSSVNSSTGSTIRLISKPTIPLYLYNTKIHTSGSSVVDSDTSATNIRAAHCRSNQVIAGTNVSNLISTPYNVVDVNV